MLASASPSITIDPHALRDRLERGELTTVLDVRPAAERAEWYIPGSVHVDAYADLQAGHALALDAWSAPPGHTVVTVCGAGKTSLVAALQLRAQGIDAMSLAGGMAAWTFAWNTADVPLPAARCRMVQVRRIGKGCLSYMAGSESEAVVVDPALDPEVYERLAQGRGWVIRHVFDTHIHADHLSRARVLAERQSAVLHLPQQQRATFPYEPVRDGDRVRFGASAIEALRVPGHTPESTCYLADSRALMTGDTLFLRSVGRPDLHGRPEELAAHARSLYRSLQRLGRLPPDTIVLPGHTDEPLSFDGRPFAARLDAVREQIEWLQLSEKTFVDVIRTRIPPTPANHRVIVRLNEHGLLPGGDAGILEAGANRCAVR
ncbi:MAG: MBL fold metallo-hydrolase [Gemmatimonadetes bacterium]|nr:MBL fold metallo-hydrolase [Gemmatimonadota bacterium]